MIRQVRFDKKQRVVDELIRRIESGLMEDGFLLPGEHQLAQEFKVSRGTLREALAELKRRNYIATQSGVGSIVTFDGVVLDQHSGWAQALADSGALVNTEVLRLEAVDRPDLLSRFGTEKFITLDRRRRTNDGTVVSLERSLMPATGGLESLPRVGLIDNSLTITLAAYGYIGDRGDRGDQWIGAEPLNVEDAELLGRPVGTVFLKALRTTYDRQNRLMEQVESLLDPVHFRLHLQFGTSE
jgi:GntR family transcriptional regulator